MAKKKRLSDESALAEQPVAEQSAIYVRTTPALKKVVTDAGNDVGESERWVMERLIESFVLLDDRGRSDVLQGRLALDRVSDLVALVSWANHAFAGHHWTWAIECYAKVEVECAKQMYGGWTPPDYLTGDALREAEERRRIQAERSPLRLFARYRQGFSWSELSLELRKKAMSLVVKADETGEPVPTKRVKDYFLAAKHSAKRAVELYESVNAVHPGIALICYNAACCAASLAMLLVESSLQFGPGRAISVTNLCKAVAQSDPDALEKAWEKIGKEWRRALNDQPKRRAEMFGTTVSVGIDEIDEYGNLAINYLNDSLTKRDAGLAPSGVPWPEHEYFPHRFWDDTDIIFLRRDSEFVNQFQAWAGTADDDWLLKSYQKVANQYASTTPMRP